MAVNELFIIGAGQMGSGIAQVAISSGIKVIMQDIKDEFVQRGYANIQKNLEKRVARGKMEQSEMDKTMALLSVSTTLEDAKTADFVIEAASENVAIKLDIFRQLDKICKPEAILASNTSSIPITEIAGATNRPDRVIGTHFFNPAPVMKLLELVVGYLTSDETYEIARVMGAEQMGKVTIKSQDRAGFIVNRMLDPFINEAIFLVDEGVGSVEDIDTGCKYGLNHPMGPLELADLIGLDTMLAIMEVLYHDFGDAKYRPCPLMRKMVRAGLYGQKNGRGFYTYDSAGKKI